MRKLKKISLHQLDKVELSKRQESLLLGGTSGDCRCGSCSSSTVNTDANRDANAANGYTGTGDNNLQCVCSTTNAYSLMW